MAAWLLCAPSVLLAGIVDFATVPMANLAAGEEGYVEATSYTDPGTGITATGYSSPTRHGTYSEANLYRRNIPNDHGIGVCSEGQVACENGGGDVNELDNDGNWEIIALTLPPTYEWVSVQLSSLDDNNAGPELEQGKLWAADNPTDASTWTLIQNFFGDDIAREPVIAIPDIHKTSPYLVFEPVNDSGVETFRNNDFLVYQAATMQRPQMCPGTGTPGYWKNHPDAWPVDEVTIGGVTYTKEEAIAVLWTKGRWDKTYTMFRALISAKLNGFIGCDCGTISDTIAAADAWMEAYGPVGSGVAAHREAWRLGEILYETMDDYNNGYDCAPHRD